MIYLQWVKIAEVNNRISQGWEIAQETACHHNAHGVILMRAPSGWEPLPLLDL